MSTSRKKNVFSAAASDRTWPSAQSEPGRMPAGMAAARGIHHCRIGEWHNGLHYLQQVEAAAGDITLPGLYYSYLGVALARCQKRHSEAIELCERAVSIGFYDPENFLNLAWARLLASDRRGALAAVTQGLALVPEHRALRELSDRLGQRQPPVLSFLPREHPLNRRLGRWRHEWRQRRDSA